MPVPELASTRSQVILRTWRQGNPRSYWDEHVKDGSRSNEVQKSKQSEYRVNSETWPWPSVVPLYRGEKSLWANKVLKPSKPRLRETSDHRHSFNSSCCCRQCKTTHPIMCLHDSFQNHLSDIKLSRRPSVGQDSAWVGWWPVCSGHQGSSICGSSFSAVSPPTLNPDYVSKKKCGYTTRIPI